MYPEHLQLLFIRKTAVGQKEGALQPSFECRAALTEDAPGELFGAVQHELTVHQRERLLWNDRIVPLWPVGIHGRRIENAQEGRNCRSASADIDAATVAIGIVGRDKA